MSNAVQTLAHKEKVKCLAIHKSDKRKILFSKMSSLAAGLVKLMVLVGVCFIILMPVIGIISKAFMDINDFYNPLVYLIPEKLTFYNIKMASKSLDYFNSLFATLGICTVTMVLQTFICALVGYGFARFKFPGSTIMFGLVILTIVVPVETMMVSMYTQFRFFDPFGLIQLFTGNENGINLIGTAWPVVLMSITGMGLRSGLYIFIYRQFFKGLPLAIEEAACIDGAGIFRTFFQIMLPNATSSTIIVALFSFVWQFNDTFFSGLFMSGMNLISQKLTSMSAVLSQVLLIQDTNEVGLMVNAGVLLAIIPLLLIYVFMQRYFVEGIERSGIVG